MQGLNWDEMNPELAGHYEQEETSQFSLMSNEAEYIDHGGEPMLF